MPHNKYGKEYFDCYGGGGPYTPEVYGEFFKSVAKSIVEQIGPKSVLEVGCAKGFLVKALRDLGVEAYGIDVSEYAVSEAPDDIKGFCTVRSVLEPLEGTYDLIICMEVLEHLPEEEGRRAVANLCRCSNDILFSSNPDPSHPDETHHNVRPPEFWINVFAEHGFVQDRRFDPSFIAPHAMRFRKRPLRITFVSPGANVAGGIKVIFEYCNGLASMGHDVNLVLLSGEPPTWFALSPNVNVICTRWDLETFKKDLPEADIIVATLWATAPLIAQCPDSKGKKFYLVQHYESMSHTTPEYADYTYWLPLRKIVVSHWLKQLLEDKVGESVEAICPGIDHNQFHPMPGFRDQYSREDIRVGMVYHTTDWKGAQDGMTAIQLAREKHPTIKIVLMGLTPPENTFYDEFWHAPDQNEICNFYNSCDLFVSSSWYEGFGLPGLEAMACGTALVTTDAAGNRDYAIPYGTALVSPPRSPHLLALNIIKAIEDKPLRDSLRAKGLEKAKEFTWERAARQITRVFVESLNRYSLDNPKLLAFLIDEVVETKKKIIEKDGLLQQRDHQLQHKDAIIRQRDESIRQQQERIQRQDESIRQQQERIQGQDESIRQQQERIQGQDESIRQQQERIQGQDESIRQQQERLLRQDESIRQQQERIQRQDEQMRQQDEQIRQQQERIQRQDEQMRQQDEQIRQQQERIEQLEATLNSIYTSAGWKFVSSYRHLKDKLLPLGSLRRRIYDLGLKRVKPSKS